MPLPELLSEDHSLHRISIQITKSQYALLKKYSRPGISISSMIRRAIDDMFAPVIEQALKEANRIEANSYKQLEDHQNSEEKRKNWRKQVLVNKEVVSEAPEIDLVKKI